MRIAILLKSCYQDPSCTEILAGLSPGDRAALGTALQLAAQESCTTVALTAGPPAEQQVLATALRAGADRAIRLVEPTVQGSDLWSVASVLGAALRHVGFDLVLAGHRSVNWGSGATGPAVAHMLDVPHVTNVVAVQQHGDDLLVAHRHEHGVVTLRVRPPALLATMAGPLLPAPRQSKVAAVEELHLSELTLPFRKPFSLPGSQLSFAEPRPATMLDGVRELAALLSGQGPPFVD